MEVQITALRRAKRGNHFPVGIDSPVVHHRSLRALEHQLYFDDSNNLNMTLIIWILNSLN